MLESVLYVSTSTLIMPGERGRVDEIVAASRSRNAGLDVTGALVFTQTYFAQMLEGPPAAVAELMASIAADSRHRQVEVIATEALRERAFPGWSMAYSGASFFVSQLVQPLVGRTPGAALKADARRLIRMIHEFVRE